MPPQGTLTGRYNNKSQQILCVGVHGCHKILGAGVNATWEKHTYAQKHCREPPRLLIPATPKRARSKEKLLLLYSTLVRVRIPPSCTRRVGRTAGTGRCSRCRMDITGTTGTTDTTDNRGGECIRSFPRISRLVCQDRDFLLDFEQTGRSFRERTEGPDM